MKAILAKDKNWAIGNKGDLLVRLSEDLKYFKEKTLGKTVVLGRKTLQTFPGQRGLPGRKNIVLTHNRDFSAEGCIMCFDPEEVRKLDESGEEVFVVGGGAVYREFLPDCSQVFVTAIEESFEADTYFENLDKSRDFELAWTSEPFTEKGITCRFTRYDRVKRSG